MTFNELLELDKQAKPDERAKPTPTPAPAQSPPPKPTPAPAIRAEATTPRSRGTMTPRHHGTVPRSLVRRLRKAVKVVGKEAATYRFSAEEKEALANIVYRCGRQGYRTSENEIVRIGMNWLIEEYREKGGQSLVLKVLRALRA